MRCQTKLLLVSAEKTRETNARGGRWKWLLAFCIKYKLCTRQPPSSHTHTHITHRYASSPFRIEFRFRFAVADYHRYTILVGVAMRWVQHRGYWPAEKKTQYRCRARRALHAHHTVLPWPDIHVNLPVASAKTAFICLLRISSDR